MKKISAMIVALAMCFSLCACGESQSGKDSSLKFTQMSAIDNVVFENTETGKSFNLFNPMIQVLKAAGLELEEIEDTEYWVSGLDYSYGHVLIDLTNGSESANWVFSDFLKLGIQLSEVENHWGTAPYVSEKDTESGHEVYCTYYFKTGNIGDTDAFISDYVRVNIEANDNDGVTRIYTYGVNQRDNTTGGFTRIDNSVLPLYHLSNYLIVNNCRLSTGSSSTTASLYFKNLSERTIKYITMNVSAYNGVGDPVDFSDGEGNQRSIRFTGPFEPGPNSVGSNYEESIEGPWYDADLSYIHLDSVDIIYMDAADDEIVHIET